MIESINAVHNLADILSVEGLDAILLGPYDLSASMGITAQFDDPLYVTTVQGIIKTASLAGMPLGIHVVDASPDQLFQRVNEGYTFLPFSIDAVFLSSSASNPLLSR